MFWGKDIKEIQRQLRILFERMEMHSKDSDRRLDNIEKVLIAQEMNLETHMKRSDHLEEIVLEERSKRDKELEPIKKHINMVEGAFKLIGLIGLIVGIVAGIAKIFDLL